ncbi:hypothetical protein [Brytella acorum]|uniref:hypothetical protein n=1 Tax=Brytella acorum TaxID=2959299 RepID=UPI0025ADC1CA|nr:hypothetical protein [Brytella acorum]MDF3625779.1 hypothetical protein [Brytella acorum]
MRRHSIDLALAADRARKREADVARARVANIIGMDHAMRLDHASSMYREALRTLGYDTGGVSPDGMEPLFVMAAQTAMHRATHRPSIAQDAAPASDSPLAGASPRRKA